MAGTRSAVEAHAGALADHPEAPLLSESLPGRTGRALQVALNRLRSSMQVAEQRRRDLEQAATHDALTGLLNRAAAFEMLDHDLARMERSGGTVMALFVDLRSEEHTSELQSLMRISYAVFCLKKKKNNKSKTNRHNTST